MKSESGTARHWLPSRAEERASLAAISGPLIAAYLVEMAMLIIDMIIVGHLGSIELAAVGLAGDWFYVLLLIGMGTVSMVAVLVAHARGRGDIQATGRVVEQGLLVATVFSLPVMIATWFLAPRPSRRIPTRWRSPCCRSSGSPCSGTTLPRSRNRW